MERIFHKFAQRYKRAKEEIDKWDSLQRHLLSLFNNAAAILERLPMLGEIENYGVLKEVDGMIRDLPAKQVESLEGIFSAIRDNLDGFERVRNALKKIWCDSCQLLKAEKLQPTPLQAQQCFGLGPSLNECIKGLEDLYMMHCDEYLLKVSIFSALSYHSRSSDVIALQTLLAEQPNIPSDEVQFIFDIFYAGESS